MRQGDLFESYRRETSNRSGITPEYCRGRVREVLDIMRAAETCPWDEKDLQIWRRILANTSCLLPDDERDEARRAFLAELERWGLPAPAFEIRPRWLTF